LDAKVTSAIFHRFEKSFPKWLAFIENSFLSEERKEKYSRFIMEKIPLLNAYNGKNS